jgi:hypothetical protein
LPQLPTTGTFSHRNESEWRSNISNDWDNTWINSNNGYSSNCDRGREQFPAKSPKACSMDDLTPPRSAGVNRMKPNPTPNTGENPYLFKPMDSIPFDPIEISRRTNWIQFAQEYVSPILDANTEFINNNLTLVKQHPQGSTDNWRRRK